jgi:hypothetical protein
MRMSHAEAASKKWDTDWLADELQRCKLKWFNVSNCVASCDRSKSEELISRWYCVNGYSPPNEIHWVDSPIIAYLSCIEATLRARTRTLSDIVVEGRWVWDEDFALPRWQIISQTADTLVKHIPSIKMMPDPLFTTTLRDNTVFLSPEITTQIELVFPTGFLYSRSMIFEDAVCSHTDSLYIEDNIGWPPLQFHQFLTDYAAEDFVVNSMNIQVENETTRDVEIGLAENLCCTLPLKNICVAVERPLSILRDENWLLHNSKGPAVRFRDGWDIFAIHGKFIPSHDGYQLKKHGLIL